MYSVEQQWYVPVYIKNSKAIEAEEEEPQYHVLIVYNTDQPDIELQEYIPVYTSYESCHNIIKVMNIEYGNDLFLPCVFGNLDDLEERIRQDFNKDIPYKIIEDE